MGPKTPQAYLLHLMKSMKETSANYAEAIGAYGQFLHSMDEEETAKLRDLKSSTSQMSFSIDELNRITHQINRCLKACEKGDVEEMERLRDELMREKDSFH